MLGLTTWWARARTTSRGFPSLVGRALRAFRERLRGLLLIIVVVGGIYTGPFTPTEAAAMSAARAFRGGVRIGYAAEEGAHVSRFGPT
jgi:C4-dicarboxylate transporter DctM subunit